ncbi:MAG: hypothetical protein AAFQ37_06320, partial [Bacteroidota bacterium]
MARNTVQSVSRIPFFAPNQVLRADDLNRLAEELQAQFRQNRVFNVGTGIQSGMGLTAILDADNPDDPNSPFQVIITVNRGNGISSDGYEINLIDDCKLTHYRTARLDDCEIPADDNCGRRYKALIDLATIELGDFTEESDLFSLETGGWKPLPD